MLFNKPIHELTFEDVVAFCKRGIPENKQLDYKYMLPKNHEKFAKTIASFANAMGGTIIVGVQDDKNDKPAPPFLGIAYHEKVRNSIEDIIQTHIDPIVFVDVNICLNKRKDRMFVVIDIPQSNLTPHLVGKLKRAYVRTGQSSRPEIIVHPDKLPWLLDHRQKSERLRHILYDKAESHFENYLKTCAVSTAGESISTLSCIPMYPQEPLTDYKQIPALVTACATRAPYGVMANPDYPLKPVQDGVAVISNTRGIYKMTEFNAYGLVMNKQVISQDEIVNGHVSQTLHVEKICQNCILFFRTARKFLEKISFGGPLQFKFKLSNARGKRALLHAKQATVLEDYLHLERNWFLTDLQGDLPTLLENLLHEAAWSLGLQVPMEQIHVLIEQYNREINL
ncbi:MAG: ATP-binding protein [Elusimicrobiaceae bacterium]|nr:ATP-binding protein [Elusimicrobiaceae bacterium]